MTIIFDSLKMNEAWANAPSLENDLINFFLKQWCKWWFLKTSELEMSECLSLTKKIFLNVKKSFKKSSRARNCMELHRCAMARVGATWHMRSAIRHFWIVKWHLTMPWCSHLGGPTPHAFPMRVLHFCVFWKKFTSFMIMKHSPSQLQTLWNLFQT